jgi:hypothetical protein
LEKFGHNVVIDPGSHRHGGRLEIARAILLGVACLAGLATTATAQPDVQAQMQAWSKALGVECTHCHVVGRWADRSKPVFDFAGRMSRMVTALNDGAMKELGGVTCWTCHRGRPIPARLPRTAWERLRADHASEFERRPDLAITMSVYAASLGVECAHCHEADRSLDTKPPKAMVARMLPVFEEIPKHFDLSRTPITQCYMCHQGKTTPER